MLDHAGQHLVGHARDANLRGDFGCFQAGGRLGVQGASTSNTDFRRRGSGIWARIFPGHLGHEPVLIGDELAVKPKRDGQCIFRKQQIAKLAVLGWLVGTLVGAQKNSHSPGMLPSEGGSLLIKDG